VFSKKKFIEDLETTGFNQEQIDSALDGWAKDLDGVDVNEIWSAIIFEEWTEEIKDGK
jgi:hypothetical protein